MFAEWSTRTLVGLLALNVVVALGTVGAVAWWAGALATDSTSNVSVSEPCDEPQPTPRPDGGWEGNNTKHTSIIADNGTYYLFYHTGKSTELGRSIGVATTTDPNLTGWERDDGNPVLAPRCGEWDDGLVGHPEVIEVPNATSGYRYHMFYFGGIHGGWEIGHAMSNDLVNWTRDPSGPVLNHGDADDWDSQRVESPSVVRTDDGYAMLYHGIGNRDGFAIGLATSNDGNLSTWERHPANPVLQAREPYERGGIRGAAFTKRLDADDAQSGAVPELRDGEYLVHYGAADRTVVGAATSPDLVDWERNRGNPLWTNATGQFEAVSDPDVYNVSGIYHAFIRAREDGHWTIIHTVIRNATAAPASGDRRPFWAVVGQFPPVGRADSIPAGGTPATGENQTAVP